MKRVFSIDLEPLRAVRRAVKVKVIASIQDSEVIAAIVEHLGLAW